MFWGLFCVGYLLLGMGLVFRRHWYISETLLEKLISPLQEVVHRKQLLESALPRLYLVKTVQALCKLPHLREFTRVPVLLCLEDMVSLAQSSPSDFLLSPEHEGRNLIKTLKMGPSIPRSPALCMFSSCGSVLVPMS